MNANRLGVASHAGPRSLLTIACATAMGLLLLEGFLATASASLPAVLSIGVSCAATLVAVALLLSVDQWSHGRTAAGLMLIGLGTAVGAILPGRADAAALLPLTGAVLTLPERRGRSLRLIFALAFAAGVAGEAAAMADPSIEATGMANWPKSMVETAVLLAFVYGLVWWAGDRWWSATERAQHALASQRHLLEVTERLLSTLDPQGVLDLIADSLKPLLAYDNLTIYQVDRQAGLLRPMVVRDRFEQLVMGTTFSLDSGVTGWVVEHGEAQCVNDVGLDQRSATVPGTPDEPESLIVVPLLVRGQVAGTLNLSRNGRVDAHFTPAEFELARLFAGHASIAIQNAEAHRAVWNRAETDSLTGLNNRGALDNRLAAFVEGESPQPCALIMLDLDGFKTYNDRHGHPAGDTVLQAVGRAIDSAVRERDLTFRYGGDEFAVLLPRTSIAQAVLIADRIREAIKQHPIVAGTLTASAGVACYRRHPAGKAALVSAADAALYRAKAAGGNCTETFKLRPSRTRAPLASSHDAAMPPASPASAHALATKPAGRCRRAPSRRGLALFPAPAPVPSPRAPSA